MDGGTNGLFREDISRVFVQPAVERELCEPAPWDFAVPLQISRDLAVRLRRLAWLKRISVFGFLLTAWTILLMRWSGQDEVALKVRFTDGSLRRKRHNGDDKAGSLLQLQIEGDPGPDDLLERVKGIAHTLSRPAASADEESGELTIDHGETQSALTLSIDAEGAVSGFLRGTGDLTDADLLPRISSCWEMLLEGMTTDLRQPASRISTLTVKERDHVLNHLNATEAPFPRNSLIHELFEEQVDRVPNELALVFGRKRVSFKDLNARANRLAHYLVGRGVGPDKLVALCVERGVDMVVGMLGVLKAGGAYVPLDPAYPPDRLKYMLEDAAPQILLTRASVMSVLPEFEGEVIALDLDWSAIAACDSANLNREGSGLTASHLAYVIYTSGSTGAPKGAMNEHRGMVNRIFAQRGIEAFSVGDICCQKTSISFVDAVFETLGALCNGLPLVIIPSAAVSDSRKMAELIATEGITRLVTVPSLARSMLEDSRVIRDLRGLRSWTLSGEEVQPDLLTKLHACLPKCEFIIQYGSSEVSSDAAIYKTYAFHGKRVPIGRPLPNVRLYVLDRHGEPVPVGMPGEIHVGGVGVGRGYLNRTDLTTERFLTDPFSSDKSGRLYKTGDLGRWRTDGQLEYLGRSDHQVKIRGFRVELGEIEAHLLRLGEVREAAVIARDDVPGQKRLVAYVALRDETELTASHCQKKPGVDTLRSHLKAELPEYMVPAAFVLMQTLPKTPNGKLDRRALPPPGHEAYSSRPYEPLHGDTEKTLAAIWKDLLQIDCVGRRDNFFELGGHSLLIVQLMDRLRRSGLFAEVGSIYASATLSELALTVRREPNDRADVPPNLIPPVCATITPQMLPLITLDAGHIERIARAVPGGTPNIQDVYPLAPLQEGIFFHSLLTPEEGDTYVRPLLLALSSRKNVDEYVRALQAVIDRHDILRTAILWEQLPQPVQVVYRAATLTVEEVTLSPARDALEQVTEWLNSEHRRLDLRRAPLMHLQVAQDPVSERWYALLNTHHLVFDDESLQLMLEEVATCVEGRARELPEPGRYRNHVANALASTRTEDAQAFFRDKLGDVSEPTAPFGLLDVHRDAQIVEARGRLHPTLAWRLRVQARRMGLGPATLFHAAWGLVVSRTSGRDDIVFGSVLLGRLQGNADVRQTLGLFINTLPLRLRLGGVTARDLVQQTQRELVDLLNHEQTPLALAQRCSGVMGSVPLFSALLNYLHSTPASPHQGLAPDIDVLGSRDRTNYPFVLSVEDEGKSFILTAQTARRVDPQRVLGYAMEALESLTTALEKAPDTAALDLPIPPESERKQIVELFNETVAAYPQNRLVHELFEEQVRRTPHAAALTCHDELLTFTQLNRKANQLAHALIARGVGPDERVAVYAQRGVDLVIALLGVLKAGGAYVPLDVSYPSERIAYMLRDSAPVVVLTQERLAGAIPPSNAHLMRLDTDYAEISARPDDNPRPARQALEPRHLAYVIYTSGSTGAPKGVMVEHRGLVNLIKWHCKAFDLRAGRYASCMAAIGFDAATWEIWPTLCAGATLIMASAEAAGDPESLLDWWAAQPLDVSFLPTPIAELAFSRKVRHRTLRTLLVGGDRLRSHPGSQSFSLINNYGPTESTVVATAGRILDDDPVLHIGRPIANTQIYILDERLRPVPLGVPGEIYIGGAGVARGYLGRPELTAERFIRDPFRLIDGGRLYKTGDVARWRTDGTIEYLGRNDGQVKVRGFRIELGEIETQLAQCGQVKEAVVIARDDAPGQTRLVAYVIPTASPGDRTSLSPEALRIYLGGLLPPYMVPSAFVMLERFPLTPNGKLDRRALPAPELNAYATQAYEAPQGELEQHLADIWQELLRVDRVGRQDNFFELGGHSLIATRVISRIREQLQVELPLKALFEAPTIGQLRMRIGERKGVEEGRPPLVRQRRDRLVPLSFAQERLWFLDHLGLVGSAYNVPLTLRLSGRLDETALERSFGELVTRHETLRTRFEEHEGVPYQLIEPSGHFELLRADLGDRGDIEQRDRALQDRVLQDYIERERLHRFNLSEAPLFRVTLIRLGPDEHALLLTLHHILVDGWSVGVLVRELSTLYACYARGEASSLPELTVQYADYAIWQRQWLEGKVLQEQLQYWRDRLEGAPTRLHLPTDRPEPGVASFKGTSLSFILPLELCRAVEKLARAEGATLFMAFLATYQLLLSRYSGQEDIVVGSPIANRTHRQTEGMIGFFVNTLVLRTDLSGSPSFREVLRRVKEVTLGAYAHQELPFETLVMELRPERKLSRQPIFQVALALQNTPHEELELAGLTWSRIDAEDRTAVFDLTLYLWESSDALLGVSGGLRGEFEYATDLFDKRTIERMATHFRGLLEMAVADPDSCVG